MGWESRARGGRYYYRSIRAGNRTRKIYIGKGVNAHALARAQAEKQQQRQAERAAILAEQAMTAGAEAALEELRQLADLLFQAAMLSAGYWNRRGEWRRRLQWQLRRRSQ
jgi:hypothetical protein